jgi:hypothetical protein
MVLAGGSLITFKIRTKQPFCPRQHQYPLFGSFVSASIRALKKLTADIFRYAGRG